MDRDLNLILGPVQNPIVYTRGPSCVRHLRHSASYTKAYQEKSLDIGLDTLPVTGVWTVNRVAIEEGLVSVI